MFCIHWLQVWSSFLQCRAAHYCLLPGAKHPGNLGWQVCEETVQGLGSRVLQVQGLGIVSLGFGALRGTPVDYNIVDKKFQEGTQGTQYPLIQEYPLAHIYNCKR